MTGNCIICGDSKRADFTYQIEDLRVCMCARHIENYTKAKEIIISRKIIN